MRKLLTVGAVAAIAIWGVAQIADDGHASFSDRDERGEVGTRKWAVSGFDRVALRGSDDVVVRVGPVASVTATGPSDLLDRLKAEVRGNELQLGREGARGMIIGFGRKSRPIVFNVTVPSLAGASVAGSGDMTVEKADVPVFRGAVAGSGSLTVTALRADSASFEIAGSGDTKVAGEAKSLNVSLAGSGDYRGERLKSSTARVKIAGSGDVRASVDGEADVTVMGSGDVDILGKPVCRVKKAGSGDVRCPA